MGVGETHKRKRKSARDFRLLCLLAGWLAGWSQNCGRFERFENKKSSSHQMPTQTRTERLRAS